jgi:hypothetical protein
LDAKQSHVRRAISERADHMLKSMV